MAAAGVQRLLRRELLPLLSLSGPASALANAPSGCSAAAWDTVEELSAAASHAKAATASKDPLEDVSAAAAPQPCSSRSPASQRRTIRTARWSAASPNPPCRDSSCPSLPFERSHWPALGRCHRISRICSPDSRGDMAPYPLAPFPAVSDLNHLCSCVLLSPAPCRSASRTARPTPPSPSAACMTSEAATSGSSSTWQLGSAAVGSSLDHQRWALRLAMA